MHNCIRNIVGAAPRGSDFFPRPDVVRLIYRRLDTDGHLNIEAPRRVGKTAVMRYLEDNPEQGYEFKYIITQAIYDPADFYELLLDSLSNFRSISNKTADAISNLLKEIKSFQVLGNKIDFHERNKDYLKRCKSIIKNFSTTNTKVVLMIDEFPQAVENISQGKGESEARKFLHANRELREEASSTIRFLYTGSLGLKPLCSKLGAIDALNSLCTIKMGALSRAEASSLCEKVLTCAHVPFEPEAVVHLLQKIHWLIPFHIQLTLQELIDEIDGGVPIIDIPAIDRAIEKIAHRRNDHYFEHYHTRILKMFPKETAEYRFVKNTLKALSQNEIFPKDAVYLLAKENGLSEGVDRILNILEYDGYIHEENIDTAVQYRFTSLLLRIWWQRNMN